jgi:hypothetical protein
MTALRRLRRMMLGVIGELPSHEQLRALVAIDDPEAQDAWLAAELDRLLADPVFYDAMVDFGHSWIHVPPVAPVADNPEYGLIQARPIVRCAAGTLHAGKWGTAWCIGDGRPFEEDCQPCNDPSTPVRSVEPWWAEGTRVEVIGHDGDESGTTIDPYSGQTIDCGIYAGYYAQIENPATPLQPMCGCGPHLAYCFPAEAFQSWYTWNLGNPRGHRRLTWEEPARLLAHIAWYDRSLEDLIAASYSVGPANLQHAYVRYARRLGSAELDENDRWWRASQWTSLVDPHHAATDPEAWSEFPIADRNPFLLEDRNYHFDPRVEEAGTMRGVPSAGVLTMPGFLGGMTRERIRGARVLEMFACDSFAPPSPTAVFAPYTHDPAAGGPCMTCHSQIDPASIHFKRFIRTGNSSGIAFRVPGFDILGVGNAHVDPSWIQGAQGVFAGDPWDRILRLWVPGSRMTPVDESIAVAEPESRFIDFLPPDQTLYGATSDGTVGPLGLAKLLINSGAFDRCAVRRLHERFVGRDVDPTVEAGYLESLVSAFVENGRRIRPFIRHLMQTEAFGRGL